MQKYIKTNLPWFSGILRHTARKQHWLIQQRSQAHTGQHSPGRNALKIIVQAVTIGVHEMRYS